MDQSGDSLDEFFTQASLPGFIENESNYGAELLETEDSQRARYSGKIVDKNMERVHSILAARAMGFPVRVICEGFAVSTHTLAELEFRHKSKLATLKDRLARKVGVFVELGMDRLLDPKEIKRMDIDKLMISVGIAIDKLQVLTGEPSVIVGTSDAPRYTIEALRERLARREPINVTATGLGDGEKEQTRATAVLPSPDAELNQPDQGNT